MEIIDFNTFAKNWKKSQIDPVKAKLYPFVKERANQIKLIHSGKNKTDEQVRKAFKEEAFLNAITDLEQVYNEFINYVQNKLDKSLVQYAKSINNQTNLEIENRFLKERLHIMDKRELTYLELLSIRKDAI